MKPHSDLFARSAHGALCTMTAAGPVSFADPGVIDVTAGFLGDVLGPVPLDKAANRILAYCTSPYSGWAVYDLASISARSAGIFDQVTVWSLLLVNALNGRVEAKQLADFSPERRREFADLIGAIPADVDLACMNDDELHAVIEACCFGFAGAWAPKITKLGALYRPRAIPVLDGYIGMAFGYQREDLSIKVQRFGLDRRQRIAKIVRALASYLRSHHTTMTLLRTKVSNTVPELATVETDSLSLIPDLRLLDIVMWTAMDDQLAAVAGRPPKWLGRPIGDHIPPAALAPEPIHSTQR